METLRRQMVHQKERLTRTLRMISENNIEPNEGRNTLEKIQQSLDEIFKEMTKIASDSEIETISADVIEDFSKIVNAMSQLKATTSCWELHRQNLDLPAFEGDITEWPVFFETFQSIHSDSSLSDAQRMRCLKSSLKGEALNLIQHLPLTGPTYQEAWSLLRDRYANKRFITNTFAQKILALPNVRKGESLRELLNHFHGAYTALRNFVPDGDLGEILVMNLIINHVDDETIQAWELSLQTTEVPSLRELLQFLEVRARALQSRMTASSAGPSQLGSSVHCKCQHSPPHPEGRMTSQAVADSNTSGYDDEISGSGPAPKIKLKQQVVSGIGDNVPTGSCSSGSVASTSKTESPQSSFNQPVKVENPGPTIEDNGEVQEEKKINVATQRSEINHSVNQDVGGAASEDTQDQGGKISSAGNQNQSHDSSDVECVPGSSRSRSPSNSSSRKKIKFENTDPSVEDTVPSNSNTSEDPVTTSVKKKEPTEEPLPESSCKTETTRDSNKENESASSSVSKRRARATRSDRQQTVAGRPQPLMNQAVCPPNFYSLNYEGWTSLQLGLLLANGTLRRS